MVETTTRSGLIKLRPAGTAEPQYPWEYILRTLNSKRNNYEVS